ncbi:MAG TPA: hypothetical protein VMZ33_04440 [Candidatus Limnocylindrales bacterium]|nr:hypothetical protein [Candidatus Limnocylindrales bacterium]
MNGTRLGALASALLLVAACGATVTTPTPATTSGPGASPTTAPAASTDGPIVEPTPTGEATPAPPIATPEPQPLPKPELHTIDDITAVLYERAQAELAIVSILDLLDIGLYAADGSVVRSGSESSDADYFVYEDEARGLATLLRSYDVEDRWVSFADFHAALVDLGLQGTPEQLAAAYNSAYEEDFESPIVQLVLALGPIDPESDLHPLAQWLLFLDGFVPPHGDGHGAAGGVASNHTPRWGVARDGVQALVPVPLEADPLVIAHLMSVVGSASINVQANPPKAHEGHGGPGSPTAITGTVTAIASTFISPFSERPLIPLAPTAGAGLPVTWHPDATLNEHGTGPIPPHGVTDPLGRASFDFTPRQEDANGEGYLTSEVSLIQASVSGAQLVTQLYGVPSLGALVGREVRGLGTLEIEWHAAEAMRISLVNTYDVTLELIIGRATGDGTDSFNGILALQEDGSWRGVVDGTATGTYRGTALGEACTTSWSARQLVEVIGQASPHALNGDFYFRFEPATPPTGSLGSGPCKSSLASYEGIDYAPYNDASITNAAQDQGLVIILPQKPGGTHDYPVKLEGVVDANWHVEIEFLEPQP